MDAKTFFYEFGKALYHVDAVYDNFAKESGVQSPAMLWILYALNDGEPHTQRELCESWDLPKSTVNTVMTELKTGGYVTLFPIPGEKREMTVSLTKSGKARANELLAGVYAREAAVFEQLTKKDKKVIASLTRITELLKE